MTQHYKDADNNLYGYKPNDIEVAEITIEEAREIAASKAVVDHASEIKADLSRIDLESVRPLRAINAGTDTQQDRDKLEELEAQAEALRQELAGMLQ